MRSINLKFGAAAAAVVAVMFVVSPYRAAAQSKGRPAKAAAAAAYGNADAIGEEELRVYLYFLASDQLEGRNFPSRGYDTAALYVASHLAEWGLKPGGSSSGVNGPLQPYLMPIELVARQVVGGESKASLTAPAARRPGRRTGDRASPVPRISNTARNGRPAAEGAAARRRNPSTSPGIWCSRATDT